MAERRNPAMKNKKRRRLKPGHFLAFPTVPTLLAALYAINRDLLPLPVSISVLTANLAVALAVFAAAIREPVHSTATQTGPRPSRTRTAQYKRNRA